MNTFAAIGITAILSGLALLAAIPMWAWRKREAVTDEALERIGQSAFVWGDEPRARR